MNNMLTDKCWIVEILGWWDSDVAGRSGWRVEQTLEATGFEVVGYLAMRARTDEEMIRVKPMPGNKATVEYMLEMAGEYVKMAQRKSNDL